MDDSSAYEAAPIFSYEQLFRSEKSLALLTVFFEFFVFSLKMLSQI